MHDRVVVAMSGGVDSSVAAALLVEQGYEVIGVMLRLWAEERPGMDRGNKCCSLEAVHDARTVAARLDIPFYVISVETPFKQQVVDLFIREYLAGHTPNPCLACNRHIRFGYLLDYARKLGATYLATGHYAQVLRDANGRYELWRGADRGKDQSYVLHMLGQTQLAQTLFPVGGYTKPEVRSLAAARGLPTASRAESQDLCFIADGDYRRFLTDWSPEPIEPGPILNQLGQELGRHKGLPFYTVGQRSGLGVAAPHPLYVLGTDSARNALIVGPLEEMGSQSLVAEGVSWISDEPPSAPFEAEVQIRYHATPVSAGLIPGQDGTQVEIHLRAPLRAITAGQGAVFYDGGRCLGGGLIRAN